MKLNSYNISRIEKLIRHLAMVEILQNAPEPDFKYSLIVGERIEISDFDDIQKWKNWVRENLGFNKYKLIHRFYSCGKAITTFKTPQSDFEIWFFCDVENYPDKFQSDNCKWTKGIKTKSETFDFICKTQEA